MWFAVPRIPLTVVVLAFIPNTREAEAGGLCEFEARLVYRMSSRTTQRNPVSKTKTEKETKKKGKLGGGRVYVRSQVTVRHPMESREQGLQTANHVPATVKTEKQDSCLLWSLTQSRPPASDGAAHFQADLCGRCILLPSYWVWKDGAVSLTESPQLRLRDESCFFNLTV